MMKTIEPLHILVAFSLTYFFIIATRSLAIRIGLVDSPGGRKKHQGDIPLIGGIAMFCGFSSGILTLSMSLSSYRSFLAIALWLTITGVLDDFHELSARARLMAQVFAAVMMVFWGGVELHNLGNILFLGSIKLSFLALPFTIFATIAVINAINMLDGLDGLVGSLAFSQFLVLSIIAYHAGEVTDYNLLILFLSVLLAFLVFNFPLPSRKSAIIFMGDAGSMFLGFSLVWFLISMSQQPTQTASPTVMLWVMLVPLFDSLIVIICRVKDGCSPLAPGRDHIHHRLLNMGFSPLATISIVNALSLLAGVVGIVGCLYQIPDGVLFFTYIGLFVCYLTYSLYNSNRFETLHYEGSTPK